MLLVVNTSEVCFRRLVSLIYLNFEQTVYRSFYVKITKQPTGFANHSLQSDRLSKELSVWINKLHKLCVSQICSFIAILLVVYYAVSKTQGSPKKLRVFRTPSNQRAGSRVKGDPGGRFSFVSFISTSWKEELRYLLNNVNSTSVTWAFISALFYWLFFFFSCVLCAVQCCWVAPHGNGSLLNFVSLPYPQNFFRE